MEVVMGNVPKLRFEGFDGEWLEKQLGEVITNKAKKYNPSQNSEIYKCIELEHLESDTGRLLGHTTSLDAGSIKNRFYPNNVLFGKLRPYLNKYHQPNFDGVCSSEIWVLSGLKVSDDFAYRIVQTPNFLALANQSSGSKMPRADWKVVESGTVSIPPSEREQQKIAAFLTAVDTKLEQLTQKEALLKQYKKGVMQKIFSQEIRFKADDGSEFPDWQNLSIEEQLISHKLGGNYANSEKVTDFPLIKMGNLDRGQIVLNKIEYIETSENVDEQDRIKFGDLFFNTRNTLDLVGKVAIWRDELDVAYYNSNLLRLNFSNNFFMNHRLNSYEGVKALRRLATGTTSVAAIYTRDLLRVILPTPCLKEQAKIVQFADTIDGRLERLNILIKTAKTFKKGLLQQMFV